MKGTFEAFIIPPEFNVVSDVSEFYVSSIDFKTVVVTVLCYVIIFFPLEFWKPFAASFSILQFPKDQSVSFRAALTGHNAEPVFVLTFKF